MWIFYVNNYVYTVCYVEHKCRHWEQSLANSWLHSLNFPQISTNNIYRLSQQTNLRCWIDGLKIEWKCNPPVKASVLSSTLLALTRPSPHTTSSQISNMIANKSIINSLFLHLQRNVYSYFYWRAKAWEIAVMFLTLAACRSSNVSNVRNENV